MNKGKVYTYLNKLQKSLGYNMKVFSVNQILRKRSKMPQLTDFIFSHVKLIDKLSSNSAGGPDGFPALVLKKCKLSLSKAIYSLRREFMDQGQVSLLLKQTTITPIHKGDSRSEPKNYRPISLTSHLTKIFERVLRDKNSNFFVVKQSLKCKPT